MAAIVETIEETSQNGGDVVTEIERSKVGFGLSIAPKRRSAGIRRVKRPHPSKQTSNLVSAFVEEAEVEAPQRKVRSISVHRLVFWHLR